MKEKGLINSIYGINHNDYKDTIEKINSKLIQMKRKRRIRSILDDSEVDSEVDAKLSKYDTYIKIIKDRLSIYK